MAYRNFNLIEGLLYRSPLRLVEALSGDRKRAWDLGYHHAIRQHGSDPNQANNRDYARGFAAGSNEVSRPSAGQGKPNSFYDLRKEREHRVDLPGEATQFRDPEGRHLDVYDFRERLGAPESYPTWEDHQFYYPWARINADSKRLGFGALKRIGKGWNGATYKSTRPGHVVKITTDTKEPHLVDFLHENPHLSAGTTMLPRYRSLHGLDLTDARRRPFSVIHRENIHAFNDPKHQELWNRFGQQVDAGYSEAAQDAQTRQDGEAGLHGRLSQHLDSTIEEHRPLFHAAGYGRHFDKVAQDLRHFSSKGLHLRDLGGRNWGQRRSGEVVLRDPGEYLVTNPGAV